MAFQQIPSAVNLAAVVLSSVAIYVISSLYLNYQKYPQFKGPFLASISGLWVFRETYAGRLYLSCAEALEKYD